MTHPIFLKKFFFRATPPHCIRSFSLLLAKNSSIQFRFILQSTKSNYCTTLILSLLTLFLLPDLLCALSQISCRTTKIKYLHCSNSHPLAKVMGEKNDGCKEFFPQILIIPFGHTDILLTQLLWPNL